MNELVGYQFSEGIATVTMDDGKANAMSVHMLQAINGALDRAERDNAVVMLTGRPGMFSGGFDLAAFQREPDEIMRMLEAGALLTQRLLSFPRPVLAVCTGHAVAMGAFVLLSADMRVGVDQGARIQIIEVQIGMTLPRFAIEVVRQRLAPAHAHLGAVTAEPYTPQQALVAGFLDAVAPADSLLAMARERAARLVKLHPESFAATKLRLRQPALASLRDAIRDDQAEWAASFGRPA